MKNLPIHQNLDTSFVNLSALVRYLRRREFIGSIRVELNGYEADITLGGENQMTVREHDRIAGRIAEGEEAFARLLIRAREPGGAIHVFQAVADTETIEKKILAVAENGNGKPFVQKEILEQIPATNGGTKKLETNFNAPIANDKKEKLPPPPQPENNLPLPFELTNRVEERAARQTQVSAQEWNTLLRLAGELLGEIDKTLAAANLDFASAFAKARAEISDDYPFLNPAFDDFTYSRGAVTMRARTSAKLFAASLNEALRRILERLGANPKFAAVHRQTIQKILALVHHRKPLYDKFFITPQLEKTLGI